MISNRHFIDENKNMNMTILISIYLGVDIFFKLINSFTIKNN